MTHTAFPRTNPLAQNHRPRVPTLSVRPAGSGGSAKPSSQGADPLKTPDLPAVRKAARRRFLDRFRRRRAERAQPASTSSIRRAADRIRPRKRRRKRTALALGVSAMGLSGATNLALTSDPIHAESIWYEDSNSSSAAEIVDPAVRRDASKLSASDALLEAMVEEEGVRYDVYRDVAGYPTVGVGHLVLLEDGLSIGDTISHERAMKLLEQDLEKAENGVRDLLGDLPVNQHEFDAMVDLVFNVGAGNVSNEKSPRLNAAIDAGDYERMADELTYTTAKNKVAKGLVYRSERRSQIFMSGDYSDPRAS